MRRLEEAICDFARSVGFSLAGIAPATPADGFDRLQEWLAQGFAGEMGYMNRHADARRSPQSVMPEVRSIIMVALDYSGRDAKEGDQARRAVDRAPVAASEAGEPTTVHPPTGKIARYAVGPDYHAVMRSRLQRLLDWLKQQAPECVGRGVVDTAPLMERDFARRAGLGWIAKNTMLINKHQGSYFFLGALLINLDLKPDSPHVANHCGTCTACLDACPTSAFPAPGWLDSRKCISYLTIELRQQIPAPQRGGIGDWVFGCDVCQEVCPWNRRETSRPEPVDLIELLSLSEEQFRGRFRDTVLFRTKRRGVLRNAAIALGNMGDERSLPALVRALADSEPLIREAAAWAIERIRQRHSAASPEENQPR